MTRSSDDSRVWLITGASSGLGRALTEPQGDRVIATARDPKRHVVQISSLEGVAPAVAGESVYAATKFAVEGFFEGLAKDVAHLGIRVTIVEPGPLRTDFAAAAIARPPQSDDYVESVGKSLEWFESIAGRQPNDPDRVAAAIIEAVGSPQPPLRLALGEEAVEAVRQKLDGHRSELDAWEELGVTTAIGRDSHPILSWGRIATPRQDRTMKSDHPARLSAALPSRS